MPIQIVLAYLPYLIELYKEGQAHLKNYSIEYLQENMQNRTDDDIFNEVLEGAKLLSSTIIENI